MKNFLLYILASASLFSPLSSASEQMAGDDLEVTVGLGGIQSPRYLGDDGLETRLLPGIRTTKGERFEASVNNGIRYALLLEGPWRAGPILTYDFGRDEDASGDELQGLGDVDGTVELGLMVEYRSEQFSSGLDLRRGVSGGHDGLAGELSLSYRGSQIIADQPVLFRVGPGLKFGDEDYLSTFFDVDASQSADSGISEYETAGGLYSVGLRASAVLPVSRELGLFGFFAFERLQDDVSESSIVREAGDDEQLSIGVFLNYRLL